MTSRKAPPRAKKKTAAKLKTQPTSRSVEGFLEGIADEGRRKDAFELLALMKKVTRKEPKMWGTAIVGFGDARYEYASGRSGDWFRAGFSPRKAALTIYGVHDDDAGPDPLLAELGPHSTGKACLYIPRLADVDKAALSRLISASIATLPGRAGRS